MVKGIAKPRRSITNNIAFMVPQVYYLGHIVQLYIRLLKCHVSFERSAIFHTITHAVCNNQATHGLLLCDHRDV